MTRGSSFWMTLGIVLAIPALAIAWWLGSPLFLDRTVDEPFPATGAVQAPMMEEEGMGAEVGDETRDEDVAMTRIRRWMRTMTQRWMTMRP